MAGINKEIWTSKLYDNLYNQDNFTKYLPTIPSDGEKAHLTIAGGKPNVIRNHNFVGGALTIRNRVDTDKTIDMVAYSTEPTRVTDMELKYIVPDKVNSVLFNHQSSIIETYIRETLFNLASNQASQKIRCSGAGAAGSKKVTKADLAKLKDSFSDAKLPEGSRYLILNNSHVSDILSFDQAFANEYSKAGYSGVLPELYGFKIIVGLSNDAFPKYANDGTLGAMFDSPVAKTSLAFSSPYGYRAVGTNKMYVSAELPEWNGKTMSFTSYLCGGSVNKDKYAFSLIG